MPTYRFRAPDGRSIKITGDGPPPTEAELEEMFADMGRGEPQQGGMFGAARGAETIGETPWYAREVPMTRLLGFGMKWPESIEEAVPSMSVTKGIRALPMVGASLGALLSSPGVVTSAGGAALGGAGGEGIRQLLTRAIGGTSPTTSEEAARGIVGAGLTQGALQVAGGAAAKGLVAGGSRLMQSAAKPTLAALKEFRTTPPKVVKTLLDEGINVTPGGLEKLQLLLSAKNAEISAAVSGAKGTIPRERVAAYAAPVAQRLSKQVNPSGALKEVEETVEEFVRPAYLQTSQPARENLVGMLGAGDEGIEAAAREALTRQAGRNTSLTVPEAQAMKVGTYQQIGKNYGKLSSSSIETQKALARGLKEEIAREVPAISALNAKEAELLAAQEVVGRRLALSGNRDPVGFAWVTSHPLTFLAALMDRSPVVKSMLANGMYNSAAKTARVSPDMVRAAMIALATQSGQTEGNPR